MGAVSNLKHNVVLRIVIRNHLSDGVTRQSNVFEKRAYNANYTVTVQTDGMQVNEGWGTPEWLVGGMMGFLLPAGMGFGL